jgi:hypothetical protein
MSARSAFLQHLVVPLLLARSLKIQSPVPSGWSDRELTVASNSAAATCIAIKDTKSFVVPEPMSSSKMIG